MFVLDIIFDNYLIFSKCAGFNCFELFTENHEAKFFESLQYFVNHVIACDLCRISSLFRGHSNAGVCLSF